MLTKVPISVNVGDSDEYPDLEVRKGAIDLTCVTAIIELGDGTCNFSVYGDHHHTPLEFDAFLSMVEEAKNAQSDSE